MKIGVNLLQYTDVQGVEVFAMNLLSALAEQGSDQEFIFFVNQESAKIFNLQRRNIKLVVKNFRKLSKIRLIVYQQFGLFKSLRQESIDILYCPSVAAPIFYRNKIITIHDCAALRFKDEAGIFSRIYLKLIFLSAKYYSFKIVTVSDFSKQEIVDLLKIPARQITVISEGAPLLAETNDQTSREILNKFGLANKPYFFYISNLRPRKNIKGLLAAWADFYPKHKNNFLVVAGKNNDKATQKIIGDFRFKDNLIFLGVISEEEKTALYKKALALAFPSLYEGFGLPILEAQSLGIPVLTSQISSLPEIAGSGALFIDPADYKSISDGLNKIISHDFLKDDLIKDGYKNLNRFSWKKSARLLLEAIKVFSKD